VSSNLAIDARHLTRKFGDKVAVADATFEVGRSEVFGFLGPNGAGKTTTTKMLTTLLPPTSGSASILGFDLRTQGSRIRERIGVVQQQDSFDQGLNVETSMDIYGLLWGVPKKLRSDRIEELIEKFSMEEFRKMSSLDLSTGQRRRLQVAREFIHDMDLLFLDEPTVGLDPKQIIEVRKLIKGLAGSHTIILSTHILPEVGMTCSRVVIINRGKIVAVDTPENLTMQLKGGERVHVQVQAPEKPLRDLLAQIPGVRRVEAEPTGAPGRLAVTVEAAEGKDVRSEIAAKIVGQGYPLYELRGVNLSLEEIFLQLTTEDPAQKAAGAA
jgi:ABC-2 type transport system ATP-binding protein